MALAVAIANLAGERESTATRALGVPWERGWIGYLNVGTRRVMADLVGAGAGGTRSEIEVVPRTPLWSLSLVWVQLGW